MKEAINESIGEGHLLDQQFDYLTLGCKKDQFHLTKNSRSSPAGLHLNWFVSLNYPSHHEG